MSTRLLPPKKAICYSGYRDGQRPGGVMPSREQIEEDIRILYEEGYEYIRMYDPNEHARMVLETIRKNNYPIKCMIGVDNEPEINAINCLSGTQTFTPEELKAHADRNDREIDILIDMANEFDDIINAVSVGNENRFELVGHWIPEERLIEHAKKLKANVKQIVTYNETIAALKDAKALGEVLDIVCFHTYPYHTSCPIDKAIAENQTDYEFARSLFPDKEIAITELGWTTRTANDDRPGYASVENQKRYITEATAWLQSQNLCGYLFEAFDETWKGDVEEASECNWGIYDMNRKRKW